MKKNELIITILGTGPNIIDGRTTIQKLAYFSSLKTGIDMGYRPHYYGPYSSLVASYLEDLVALDFVIEKGRRTVRDRTMYSYTLNEDGSALVKKIERKYPDEYSVIKDVVTKCDKIVHNNVYVLSWAAKVHYVLAQTKKSMTYDDAIAVSKLFGWKLSEKQVESAVKLLLALRLIKRES